MTFSHVTETEEGFCLLFSKKVGVEDVEYIPKGQEATEGTPGETEEEEEEEGGPAIRNTRHVMKVSVQSQGAGATEGTKGETEEEEEEEGPNIRYTVDGFIFVGTNFYGLNKNHTFLGFKIRVHSIFLHNSKRKMLFRGYWNSWIRPSTKTTKICTPQKLSHPQYRIHFWGVAIQVQTFL